MKRTRAFTLLETVLVAAILGLLASLLLPAIAGVRRAAVDAASLANLNTHARTVTIYSGDFRDFAPYFADPNATYSVVRGAGRTIVFEYFGSSEVWPYALVDRYYGIGIGEDRSVFARRGEGVPVYQYSPTFIARPAFWNEATRGVNQLGPVRVTQVQSPSSKAIFLEWDPDRRLPIWTMDEMPRHERWAFAFTDGSARRHGPDTLVKPYPRGEGTEHGARFNFGIVGMHTVDGVLGRDTR